MNLSRREERQALLIGSLIVFAGIVAASNTLYDSAQEIIIWAEGLILRSPEVGMLIFVLISMISAMIAFFSAVVLTPVAINVWGTTTSLVLLWIGWVLGGVVSYCIGLFLGRSIAAKWVGESTVASWHQKLVGRTRFFQVLLFVTAVPSEVPGYVLGVVRYRFIYFLTAIAIGYTPHALAAVFLGDSFLKGRSLAFILIGAGILLGAIVYRQYRGRNG